MTAWQLRPVTFRFQLGDWVLFKATLPMQVRAENLWSCGEAVARPVPPSMDPIAGSQGYSIHSLPVASKQPELRRVGDYLCYIPLQYDHCYIDLSWSFDMYQNKFNSKTRSTIHRKIRKYKEHCGGAIRWKAYTAPDEIRNFVELARQVSKLTYQERLLDVGLPDTDEFIQEAVALAASDRLRAFILFDGARPVAYLYCPEQDGILTYAYLGYDPQYGKMSVGTVLQWLAVEQIFQERKFRYFDFTEGQSDHKQLFASHQRLCANVFFVKWSAGNALLVHAHLFMDRLSRWLGVVLARYGLKAKVRQLLRRI